jgi:hypothetical protein
MKIRNSSSTLISRALTVAVGVFLSTAGSAGSMQGQATARIAMTTAVDTTGFGGGSPDGLIFLEGTRAINEGRWNDAVTIFSKIAERRTDHADGALYWMAYAENKLGQAGSALETCARLRNGFPKSGWLDECGALEIEIHAGNGQPVTPKPEQSDDLKLLALNSMLQHDTARAKVELEEILNDEDSSQRLKEGAQFLLGQHHTGVAYPQIARVSFVEGDVRIARGKENENSTGSAWEKAEANTPLETGFSLVTGTGRAEIELEDASTLYLGDDSVLAINDLHTTDGIPYSEMALLSGTATLHVKPYVPGEMFILKTPTDDNLMAAYPNTSLLRVTSYVDATAITAQEGGILRLPGSTQQATTGQTLYFRGGHRIEMAGLKDQGAYGDWDKWVADRVAARTKAMQEAMTSAGLASPMPGLEELASQGRFFDCAPYGKCWEPAGYAETAETGAVGSNEQAAQSVNGSGTQQAANPPGGTKPTFGTVAVGQLKKDNAAGGFSSPGLVSDDEEFFPCYPGALGYHSTTGSGQHKLTGASTNHGTQAYAWGVCHAGSWIEHRHHYVWVVGKRHHHEPVQWIKSGRLVAIVPIHPRDVKGEPPVNGKEKVFPVVSKGGAMPEPVRLGAEKPIEVLKSPPKEFRAANLPPLERAAEPRVAAHEVKDSTSAKVPAERPGISITFDHKSQSFLMARQTMQGNRTVMVTAPITNRGGDLQSHAASVGGAGGGVSHAAGGGSSGGSGGATHSSGGGSSSAASSTSSSSGSGSHH